MKFLIVGDSHTQYFGVTNQVRAIYPNMRGIKAIPKVVSASTVTGVGKVNSTLELGDNIKKWYADANPDFLVLNLGQVDVELGIPFRQFVQGKTEDNDYWLDFFIEKYFSYISTIEIPNKRLIIKGINLPVLCYDWNKAIKYISRIVTERFTSSSEDNSRKDEIIKKLTEKYSSDIERSDLARKFNQKLKENCAHLDYGYFDINDHLMQIETEMIHPRFIPSKFDHHIVDSVEVRLFHWQELLRVARPRI